MCLRFCHCFENDPTKNEWGFTIIRREDPGRGVRNSIYRYFVIDEKIPHFEVKVQYDILRIDTWSANAQICVKIDTDEKCFPV